MSALESKFTMDPTPAANRAARGERLESWKEIAAYLKRDIRTVQRWEKQEALPVYRHLHDERGTAYAYAGEIDEWLQQRSHREVDAAATADVTRPEIVVGSTRALARRPSRTTVLNRIFDRRCGHRWHLGPVAPAPRPHSAFQPVACFPAVRRGSGLGTRHRPLARRVDAGLYRRKRLAPHQAHRAIRGAGGARHHRLVGTVLFARRPLDRVQSQRPIDESAG